MDTPIAYARAIAYLGDASKIRARTCDMFGRSPPLIVCERIVSERMKARAPANFIGAGQPDDTDANGFAVRGLVPQMPAPKPKHPPMVIVLPPVARKLSLDLNIPSELAIAVADAFGLTRTAMLGDCRKKNNMTARAVYVRLLRDRLTEDGEHRYSLKQIATRIKRNDHTTVRHILATYDARARQNPQMDRVYAELKAMGA